jgi:hypothetical protein
MKKVTFLLTLFVTLAFSSMAQFGRAGLFPLVAKDTLVANDTIQKVITATAGYNAIGIQANINKLSGTLTGKMYLYTSLDNANFTLTDSASYVSTVTSSFSTPTYTHTAIITKQTVPGVFYRIWLTSSATVSAPVQVWYTLRKNINQ